MIVNAREHLDPNFHGSYNGKIVREPKTLTRLCINIILKDYEKFFARMACLPTTITDKYPEIDIDYCHKFINRVKQVILRSDKKAKNEHADNIKSIWKALEEKDPYQAIDKLMKSFDKMPTFKKKFKFLLDEIASAMKVFSEEKDDYIAKMEKSLG